MWKNLQDILSSERKEKKNKNKTKPSVEQCVPYSNFGIFFNEINKNDIHICLYVHQETLKEYIRNFKNKGAL